MKAALPELTIDFYLAALPIFILSLGALVAMLQAVSKRFSSVKAVAAVVGVTVFAALVSSLGMIGHESGFYLAGSYISEQLGRFGQVFILAVAGSICLLFWSTYLKSEFFRGEMASLYLMTVAGMLVMVSSDELITLFIGLELSSIGLYSLVGYLHPSQKSQEGAIKYFILGSFAAAFLLFGFALLYAATGTMRISELLAVLPKLSDHIWVRLGGIFTVAGLGFKLALVPFHMWAPDTYEAAPTGITALMATCAKVMILIVTLRFFSQGMEVLYSSWLPALMFLAIMSMIFGNLLALVQTSLKRMLAYSSIAHSGYMAVALCAIGGASGALPVDAVLFYIIGYAIVSVGAFGAIMWLEHDKADNLQLDDLAGLVKTHPWAALGLAVFMFSFSGMPPTVGFITKFFIFNAAIANQLYGLVIVGAVGTAISLFYYLRVVVKMFMTDEVKFAAKLAPSRSPLVTGLAVISIALTILLGTVLPGPVMESMRRASQQVVTARK